MDLAQDYVKPLKEFAKDSIRLVKRCTKPDLKGSPPLPRTLYKFFSFFRISKDCFCYSCRFCYNGLHWFLCKAHSYSHQQYFGVSFFASFPNFFYFLVAAELQYIYLIHLL